nr:MAG TPA: hypothetical protein [Caudoviricetes sp.]
MYQLFRTYVFIGLFLIMLVSSHIFHYMVYTFSNAGLRTMIIKTYNPVYFWYSILFYFYSF